ncbi:MAG TPA: quinoprotein relay system zinc metallohydrolase 2 [Methylophilaceae bacterium]|nr:quinoprotein relay system zinc metallohydrolase 2 [Methylophilaceae bacterium]
MNRIKLTLILPLFLLFAARAFATEALPMEKVAEGIYVHHGVHEDLDEGYHGDIANIGFIVGSKGVAVIDSGGSLKVGQRLHESIRQVTQLPILYVINTHVHPDHVFGNAAFLQDKPVFVGHEKLPHAMAVRKDAYMRSNEKWLGADFAGSELIPPTETVPDSQTLDLGDRTLELKAYPTAHTNTDITVLDSKTGTLWTGDLLFVERIPSIDGDIKGWLSAIKTVKSVPARKVVPGHGPVVEDGKQAFDNEARYLSVLLNDVRSDIKKGIPMEKSMSTAAASEKNNWKLFDIINRRNVNLIYPELEWE